MADPSLVEGKKTKEPSHPKPSIVVHRAPRPISSITGETPAADGARVLVEGHKGVVAGNHLSGGARLLLTLQKAFYFHFKCWWWKHPTP